MKFLPNNSRRNVKQLGWDRLDVLLISGDTYLDTSYNGSVFGWEMACQTRFSGGNHCTAWKWTAPKILPVCENPIYFAILRLWILW